MCVCVIFRLMCNVLKTHLLFRAFFFCICGFILRTCDAKINGLTDTREHKFHGECRILAVMHSRMGNREWNYLLAKRKLHTANCLKIKMNEITLQFSPVWMPLDVGQCEFVFFFKCCCCFLFLHLFQVPGGKWWTKLQR